MSSATWKDNIQSASFRGETFFVKSHSSTVGRRVISHEFPFGDKPFTEDLGKKSRAFNIDGFILGDDYFKQRDAIISACEKFGSGELVHPYLGRLQVNCQSLSIAESDENGGYVSLSFQFVESGDALSVLTANKSADKLNEVQKASDNIKESALSNFKQIYKLVNTAKSGIEIAKQQVMKVVQSLNEAQKLCADVAQIGNDTAGLVRETSNAIDKIIFYPQKVSSLFELSYETLSTSIDKFASKNKSQKRLMAIAATLGTTFIPFATTSPSPSAQSAVVADRNSASEKDTKRRNAWLLLARPSNNDVMNFKTNSIESKTERRNSSIIGLTKNAFGLSFLANAAAKSVFSTIDDANNAKNIILTIADEILCHPLILDELYTSIQNLQSSLSDAINSIENTIPIISKINTNRNTNILSFLYDNFENFDKEEDIISRNNIADPFDLNNYTKLMVAV